MVENAFHCATFSFFIHRKRKKIIFFLDFRYIIHDVYSKNRPDNLLLCEFSESIKRT